MVVIFTEKQNDRTADNEWLFVEKPTHLAAQRRHIPLRIIARTLSTYTNGKSWTYNYGSACHF